MIGVMVVGEFYRGNRRVVLGLALGGGEDRWRYGGSVGLGR